MERKGRWERCPRGREGEGLCQQHDTEAAQENNGPEWQKRARKSDVKEAHKSEREDWGGEGESGGGEEADWESERQKLRADSVLPLHTEALVFSVDFLDLWSKNLQFLYFQRLPVSPAEPRDQNHVSDCWLEDFSQTHHHLLLIHSSEFVFDMGFGKELLILGESTNKRVRVRMSVCWRCRE